MIKFLVPRKKKWKENSTRSGHTYVHTQRFTSFSTPSSNHVQVNRLLLLLPWREKEEEEKFEGGTGPAGPVPCERPDGPQLKWKTRIKSK